MSHARSSALAILSWVGAILAGVYWRPLLPALLVVAGIASLVVLSTFEWFPLKWTGWGRTPAATAVPDERSLAPSSPRSDLELLSAAQEKALVDALRADLVSLSDELADARRALLVAYNDRRYWGSPISVDRWEAIKDIHLAAKGFHEPRSRIAEAYQALKAAHKLWQEHYEDYHIALLVSPVTAVPPKVTDADRDEIRGILNRVLDGENALGEYLETIDSQT